MSSTSKWDDDIDEFARRIFCDMVDNMQANKNSVSVAEIAQETGENDDQVELAIHQLINAGEGRMPLVEKVGEKYKVKAHAVNQAKEWSKSASSINIPNA